MISEEFLWTYDLLEGSESTNPKREKIERSSRYHLVPQVYEPDQCRSQPNVAPTVNERKQLAT